MKRLIFIFCLLIGFGLLAQTNSKSILLLDATAHLGNGEVISRSAIGIKDAKINLVLNAFDIRLDTGLYDSIIHLKGKHIYPGFIAPNSRLGLVEIEAVRATRDFDDVGDFNPHVRSLTAYNTESKITATVKSNGVLMAQVSPKGGFISGSSSIFNLDAWNWEDAVAKPDDGIHIRWPISRTWSSDVKKQKEAAEKYKAKLIELSSFFNQSLAYLKKSVHLNVNLRFEAMRKVNERRAKVFVHVHHANEIRDALYFFDEYDLDLVLVGAYDAWLVSDMIKDRAIPVILQRIHSLPRNVDDEIDLPFRLPKILHEAGIIVSLENSGSMEAMGTRNLPFYAGTAVAYGVEKEQALKMITLNTAIALGIDNNYGSIEKGKFANLFISKR